MKYLPHNWYWEEVCEPYDGRHRFQGLALLYCHTLLDNLERRILAQIGGDVKRWEKALEDAPTWRWVTHDCPRAWTDNYTSLAEHCRRLEATEIAALTGRAA